MTVHKVKLNNNYSWFIETSLIKPGDILLYECRNVNGHLVTKYVYVVMSKVVVKSRFVGVEVLTSENRLVVYQIPLFEK